jgi:predicted alpha/beta superfamily hydrolase
MFEPVTQVPSKYLTLLTAAIFCLLPAAAQTPKPCAPTVVGTLETFELPSKVFDYTRTVRVFLPSGYSDPTNRDRHYPVFYMFDGQNLFDACLAYDHVHEWQVDETITRLITEGKIEPLIVVGLDNAKEKRAFEYLPWNDDLQTPGGTQPGGQRMPEFLVQEVIPAIKSKYRIAEDRENTGIGGSSYGAIAALYVGVHAPKIFGKVLAESPVLVPGNGAMLRETSVLALGPLKVFMAFGGKEWDMPGANESEVRMIRQLESNFKGALSSPSEVRIVIDPEARHNEEAWAKRFPEAITFLFPHR